MENLVRRKDYLVLNATFGAGKAEIKLAKQNLVLPALQIIITFAKVWDVKWTKSLKMYESWTIFDWKWKYLVPYTHFPISISSEHKRLFSFLIPIMKVKKMFHKPNIEFIVQWWEKISQDINFSSLLITEKRISIFSSN